MKRTKPIELTEEKKDEIRDLVSMWTQTKKLVIESPEAYRLFVKQLFETIGKDSRKHDTDSPYCWCKPKQIFVPESNSWVTVHEPEERIN